MAKERSWDSADTKSHYMGNGTFEFTEQTIVPEIEFSYSFIHLNCSQTGNAVLFSGAFNDRSETPAPALHIPCFFLFHLSRLSIVFIDREVQFYLPASCLQGH
jgi:hypothetical protein